MLVTGLLVGAGVGYTDWESSGTYIAAHVVDRVVIVKSLGGAGD